MSSAPVSTIIFTLNEEIHLPSCMAALGWCDDVVVVDSFSTDRTEEIARAAGARFFTHAFEGFGQQRMWALEDCHPRHPWVLILDADERVTPELARELRQLGTAPESVAAYRLRRRFHMWGRWLRYSSLYPSWVVRVIRVGRVTYVDRGHAETQLVSGAVGELWGDLIDENLKGDQEWYARQERYAAKEAHYEIAQGKSPFSIPDLWAREPLVRRAALKRLASGLPMRPLFYFIYSYLLRGGFRDGRDGFTFCRMKADYQKMIVTKKRELERRK